MLMEILLERSKEQLTLLGRLTDRERSMGRMMEILLGILMEILLERSKE